MIQWLKRIWDNLNKERPYDPELEKEWWDAIR